MVRSGKAENVSGAFMFFVSGKNRKNYALSEAKLVNSYGAHSGSKFCLNENRYTNGAD